MKILVGIDPGTQTGYAVWHKTEGKLLEVAAFTVIQAMDKVLKIGVENIVELRFEDARKRKWFGSKGREALQGAGSIKRDCAIWEEFCTFHGIKFKVVPPQKGATKWDAKTFERVTGWKGRTNEHARDAGVLVFGG